MSYYFVHPLKDDGTSFSYRSYPNHDGNKNPNKVDISNLTLGHTNGNKVLSMTNGTVEGFGTFSSGIGYVVINVTDDGAAPIKRIRYLHLNNTNFEVKENGESVTKGQVLGYVADEGGPGFGEGDGAHLHVDFDTSDNGGVDFGDVAPISSEDHLDSSNYDETIYQGLCSDRGVSSDISSQYYWPYMLWAQKSQSAQDSIKNGTEVDLNNVANQQTLTNSVYIYTKYDEWFPRWANSSNQKQVSLKWDEKGREWKNGIAVIDGRYLVAVVTEDSGGYIGHVGCKIDIYLKNGTIIPAIIADAKNSDDEKCTAYGHWVGTSGTILNVVEFEVNSATINTELTAEDDWNSTISKIVVGESIIN